MDSNQYDCSSETMEERSTKYQLLSEHAIDAIFFIAKNGKILDVNNAAIRMYGYTSEEFLSLTIMDIRRFYEKELVLKQLSYAESEGHLFETIHFHKDGSALPVEVSSQGANYNDERIIVSIVRNISERKKMEESLHFLSQLYFSPSEDFFYELARFISEKLEMEYICIDRLEGDNLTAQTLAVFYDGKFEDNVSYSLKDTPCGALVGKCICTFPENVKSLFPNDEFLQEMLAESYVGTTLFNRVGRPIGLIATISRKPLKNPRISEMLLEIVSARASGELERRLLEEELLKATKAAEDANLAKSNFLANISHEIRTPMNGIMGAFQLAMLSELSDEVMDYMTIGKSSTESLLDLVDDVLDFSKAEANKLELTILSFNIINLIKDVVNLFKASIYLKGLQINYSIAENIPKSILGDSFRIRQILSNLIGNAVKFTPKGGISVSATLIEETSNQLTLQFAVKDTGIGIARNQKELLFNRFKQLDNADSNAFSGSGLGLAISKQLVELMNGEIWVESDAEGSCFYFTCILCKEKNNL